MSADPLTPAPAGQRRRLGELLVDRGCLQPAMLERALKLQRENGERLGQLLLQLGMILQM